MNNGVKIQITGNSDTWRIIEMNTTENMPRCFQLYQLFENRSLNYLIKLHKNSTLNYIILDKKNYTRIIRE